MLHNVLVITIIIVNSRHSSYYWFEVLYHVHTHETSSKVPLWLPFSSLLIKKWFNIFFFIEAYCCDTIELKKIIIAII